MSTLTVDHVAAWMSRYRHAWQESDADLVVDLFTEDATYRSFIYAEPHVGHDGIRAYWTRATGTQRDVRVLAGAPLVADDRAAIEWWTTMTDEGSPATLAGMLLLTFAPDGRCAHLREYWHADAALHEPPPRWGQ